MKKILQFKHFFFSGLFFILLWAGNLAEGASFTAIQSGNWNDPATWGSLSFPGTGDDISVGAGITVTMNVAGECRSITDMPGGSISGFQSLTITGNAGIVITILSGSAFISCPVILPAMSSITVDGTLNISGEISGSAIDLTKNGTGKLILSGINIYDGTTTVNAGILNIQNGQGAGTPANGIIVNNSAQLELESAPVMFIDESLSLSGTGVSGSALVNVSGTNVLLGPIDIDGASTNINCAYGDLLIFGAFNLKSNLLTINVSIPIFSTVFMPGLIYTSTGTGSMVKDGSGELSFGSQAVAINSLTINQGTLKSTLGVLSLEGDFINNGTFDHNGGTLEFNGVSSQSIGGSQQTIFNNLTLNNSAGAILGNSISIDGTLTLADGRLHLGSYNLTLGSAAVAGTPSVTNMIVTDGLGECRRIFNENGSYLFPIGDETGTTEYTPATLNFTSDSYSPGSYAAVRVTDDKHPANASTTDFLTRYWTVSQSGISTFAYDFTGTFNSSDITGNIADITTGMLDAAIWQNKNPITGSDISASGVTIPGDFTGISATTSPLKVTITANPTPIVCKNAPVTLTANTVGNPSLTYVWSPNGETTQSIAPSTAVTGSILYSVTVTDVNGNTATDNVTLTVNEPSATITGTTTICQNQSPLPLITFTGAGGTAPYIFTYTYNGGANITTSQSIGNTITIDAVAGTPGIDKYDLISVSDANTCSQNQNGEVIVTIDPSSIGGTISGSTSICSGTNSTLLTLSGQTGAVIKWQYSTNGGTSWTDISNTGITYTATNVNITTDFRAVIQNGICPSANSAAATIIITPASIGGSVTGGASVCSVINSTTLTLSGQTGAVIKWQYSINSGTSWTDILNTGTSFTTTNLNITTDFRAVIQNGICPSANSAAATIIVTPASIGGSVTGGASVCSGINSTTLTLSGQTGAVIKWQYSTNGGTSWTDISNTGTTFTATNLIVTTDFRAVIQNGICPSANSAAATIIVTPASIGGSVTGGANVCSGINSTTLTLSGQTGAVIKWQYSTNGGTSWTDIPNTGTTFTATNLNITTDFRAVIQNGICPSANSAAATIIVTPASIGGSVTGGANVCSGINSTTLTLSGQTGAVIKWQFSTNGGTSWTDISNTGTSFTTTNLNITTDFRAVIQNGICPSANSAAATIIVTPASIGGLVTGGASVCSVINSTTLTLSGQTGAVIKWQYSINSGTSWTDISNTGTTYTATNLTITTDFRAVIQNGSCLIVYSDKEVITVNPNVSPGTIGTAQTICYNAIPAALTELSPATGGTGSFTYQWQSSPNNSTWTTIADSTLSTFSPGALVSNVYYRRIVTSGSCGSANTSGVLITVRPNLAAPVASGTRTICFNSVPTALTATTATGGSGTFSYQWQASADNVLWADISGATNYSSYTPSALSSTSYYRLIATATGIPSCGMVTSNVITITVLADLSSPVASADQTICFNTSPVLLTSTVASGGSGTFSYQWYSSLNNSSWSIISGATGLTYQPASLTTSTYYHIVATATGSPACGTKTSNPVLITVNPNVSPGTIGTAQTICYNTIPAALTELSPATGGTGSFTYQWQSSPNNSVWTTIADSTLNTFAPGALVSNVYYRRIVTSGSCGSANTSGVLITVRPNLAAPVASGTRTICFNSVPTALTATTATGGSGTFSYQWQASADNVLWADISGATNYSSYTPSALSSTSYYRLIATATGSPSCGLVTSNVITITVLADLSSPVASADQTICFNTSPVLLTSTVAGGGSGTFSYQWYSSLNNSSWSIISGATGLTYQPASLTTSTYYHIVATATGSPACGTKTSNPVLITVNPNVSPGTIGTAQTICYNTIPAALTELSPATGGTGSFTYQWQSSPNNSTWTTIADSTLSTFAPGALVSNVYYRRIVTSGSCGSANTSGVLITVRPNLAAPVASGTRTICYNTVPAALTATTATGGSGTFSYQWQASADNVLWADISGATNYSSYTPSALSSTSYYRLIATATGIPSCGLVTSNVITITVLADLSSPVASADQTICFNTSPVLLTSTVAGGGSGTFSYQWYSSLNNSSWSTISGATGLTYQPASLTTSTYYHIVATATGSPACGTKTSNPVFITVNPNVGPGTIGTAQTICYNTIPAALTELSPATGGTGSFTYQWQSSPNNSTWTTIADSTLSTFSPGALVSNVYYRRIVTSGSCGSANTSGVLITVRPNLAAPVASGTRTICYNTVPAALTATTATGGSGTFSYQWQASADNVLWADISGATNYSSYTPSALSSTSYYRLIATATGIPSCGLVTSNVITITVLADLSSPVASADQTICFNTSPVLLTSTVAGGGSGTFSYQWYSSLNNSSWSTISGATGLTYQPASLTTSTYYHIVATATGSPACGTKTSNPVLITVNPSPVTIATPTLQTICSGTTSSIALTSVVAGTTFSWTVVQSDVTGASSGSGTSISQTLTTSGITSGTATYTITPRANGCDGAEKTVVITVNPNPEAIALPASQTRCSGTTTSVGLTSNVSGTSYIWTVSQTGVSGASAGSGSMITQTLTATGVISGIATYSITPTANSCSGTPIDVLITVYPSPVVTISPAAQTICSGVSTSIALSGNVSGSTFSWTVAQSGVTGATSSSGTSITQTLNALGALAGTATYTITPAANGCSGSSKTAIITVNPSSVVTVTPPSQTICSNSVTTIALSSPVSGTTFNWTYAVAPALSITGAANGSGNSISQTLVNTTLFPANITYSVIPTANGCIGNPVDVIVTVNPVAKLSSPTTTSVCSNNSLNYTPTSNTPFTTFAWTRAVVLGIQNAANSGTGAINETLINTTGIAKMVTYVYTLTTYSCTTIQNVVVIVYPTPILTSSLSPPSVCSTALFSYNALSSVTGTTLTWSRAVAPNISNAAAMGSGDINELLVSTSATDVVVPYVYLLSVGGCTNSLTVNATIKPTPNVTIPSNQVYCNGDNIPEIVFTGTVSGTIYTWGNNNTAIGQVASGTGNIASFTATNTSSALITGIISVRPNANGCNGANSTFNISVYPASTGGTVNSDVSVCGGSNTGTLTLSGQTGAVIKWQSSTDGGANWADISNTTTSQTYTNLITTTQFRAVVQSGVCGTANSSIATITVNQPSVGGTVTADATVCYGTNNGTLTLSGETGNIIKWQSSINGGAIWSDISNTTNTQSFTNLATTTQFRAIVQNGSCVAANSSIASITISPASVGGSISGGATVCSGTNSTTLTLNGNTGSVTKWQSSSVSDFSSDVTDIANTTNSLSVLNIVSTTYFRAEITSGVCSQAFSTSATITVNPMPVAVAGGSQTICSTGTAIVSGASALNGSILWTENGAGSITAGATTLTPTYTAAAGDAGNTVILTMTVTSTNACAPQTAIATYTVNVNALPTAFAGGSQTICSNGTALVSGATATNGIISWTENGAGSITAGTTTLTPVYIADAADAGTIVTLTMTVTSNNACTPQTATATYTVTVDPLPIASAGGSQTICSTGTATVSGATSANGTIAWTENGAGSITAGINTLTPTYTSVAADAGTTVTLTMVVTSNNACIPQVATATYSVIVNPASVGGSVSGSATVCSGTNSTLLTLSGQTGNVVKWQSSSNNWATIVDIANTTTTLTATNLVTTTKYRAVVQNGVCSAVNSGEVIVMVTAMPALLINDPAPVCTPSTVNITLAAVTTGSTLPAGTLLTYWTDAAATIAFPTPTTANADTYWIKATTPNNCSDIKPVSVNVFSTLGAVNFNPALSSAICKGSAPITFSATAVNALTMTYSLDAASLAAGNSIIAATGQVTFSATFTGTMEITATATGCGGSRSQRIFTVIINNPPTVTFPNPPTPICEGTPITLSATSTSTGTTLRTFSSPIISLNQAVPESRTSYAGSVTNIVESTGLKIAATDIIEVTANITHINNDQLDLFLVGPNGGCMLLSSDNGASGDNYDNALLRTGYTPKASTLNGVISTVSGIYGTEGDVSTLASQSGGNGGNYGNTAVPQTKLIGSPINGNWEIRVFDDVTGTGTGILKDWSITIKKAVPVNLTTVLSGPGTNGTIYSGTTPLAASQTFNPPSGTNVYTATTSDGNGCSTSKTATVIVNSMPTPVITADYCTYRPKVFLTTTQTFASYLWSTGATSQSIQVDIAGNYTVTVTTAAGCSASSTIPVADELVTDGSFTNFNAAAPSFFTEYGQHQAYYTGTTGTGLWNEGLYAVNTSAYYNSPGNLNGYHPSFHGRDHTNNISGTRNYMLVNGSTTTTGTPPRQLIIWQQTVTVTPNTDYYFSAWGMNLNPTSPAQLQFEVNGVLVGSVADLNVADKPASEGAVALTNWVRFYSTPMWNSGASTTAVIRIRNLNTTAGGNDFGLDDISFGTLANVPFTVSASSNSPSVSPICSRNTLQLFSTVTGGRAPIVYSWTGPNGFTSNAANPVISNIAPNAGGVYTLSVFDYYNCPGTIATTTVALNPTPEIPNQAISACSNAAFNATPANGVPTAATFVPVNTAYTWAVPVITGGLTGGAAGTGLTSISGTLSNPTTTVQTATYTVTPYTYSGTPATPLCTGLPFTVVVSVYPVVTVNAGANRTVCSDAPGVTLAGTFGGAATSAAWTGGTGTFNPNRNTLNAIYTPSVAEINAGTVTLTLTTNDPAGPCSSLSSGMTITIGALPLLVSVPTHVKCFGENTGAVNLTVTGGGASPAYLWKRSDGTTVALTEDISGLAADTYSVEVTGTSGCNASNSVTITQPAAALSTSAAVTGMLCAGGASGTITLTVSGGTTNYTYSWIASGGGIIPAGQATNKNLTGLVSGTYTVTVTDANSCTVILSNTVTVAANIAPVITTCPVTRNVTGCSTASITGPVFSASSSSTTYAIFNNVNNLGVATDNCAITTVTYQDIANSSCPITVTRTWTIGDASGLTTTCQQLITVTDVVAPIWTNAVGSLNSSIECTNTAGLAAAQAMFPTASDACDTDVTNIIKTSGAFVAASGCSQAGTYTNTWRVTDECGNISIPFTQVITITDNAAPVWTTAVGSLNRTIECSDITALTAAQALSPIAIDNCDNDVTNVIKMAGAFVSGGVCSQVGTYTNRWTVADDCGNVSAVFNQIITVTDNTAPIWITAPGDINRTVECSDAAGLAAAMALFPSASDNCVVNVSGTSKVSGLFVPSATCAQDGTYTNTWTVSDGCGNTSSVYVQIITLVDNSGPVINCPASDAFSCDSPSFDPAITGTATVTDNCDANPALTWADAFVPGACPGNYQIIRTWTATDACGNSSSCNQTIFVQDVKAPVITCSVSGNQNVNPNPAIAYVVPDDSWNASATDNCSGVSLSVVLAGATVSGNLSTLNGVSFNEGVTTVTWTATDGCGISSQCQFTVTVTFKPEISCPADILHTNDTDLCSANFDPGFPALTVGTAPISYSWNMTGATIGSGTGPIGYYTFNSGITTINWTASNMAGAGLCSQTITVTDNQAPTFSIPTDKNYCVSDIITANFDNPTMDINPGRPDYYIFEKGNTDLDLNPSLYIDNCPINCVFEIRWRIDFEDGTFLPALPALFYTGQPSAHNNNIQFAGDALNSVLHHITYQIVDCSGNISAPQKVKIAINPRPNIIKTNSK